MGCCHDLERTVTEDNQLLKLELKQNQGQTPGKYQNFTKTQLSIWERDSTNERGKRESITTMDPAVSHSVDPAMRHCILWKRREGQGCSSNCEAPVSSFYSLHPCKGFYLLLPLHHLWCVFTLSMCGAASQHIYTGPTTTAWYMCVEQPPEAPVAESSHLCFWADMLQPLLQCIRKWGLLQFPVSPVAINLMLET